MVDVGAKPVTQREATAEGWVRMAPQTLALVEERRAAKGDVVTLAEIAAVQGAKKAPDLIPLCHPIGLDGVDVVVRAVPEYLGLHITVTARVTGRTGVEMEALAGVSAACLTVYDMLKAVDRGMEIGPVRLIEKRGGRSGTWRRGEAPADRAPGGETGR